MVTIKVRKRYGAATVDSSVTAESIERALALAGPGARVVFPLDPETFFAQDDAQEEAEILAEAPVEDPARVAA